LHAAEAIFQLKSPADSIFTVRVAALCFGLVQFVGDCKRMPEWLPAGHGSEIVASSIEEISPIFGLRRTCSAAKRDQAKNTEPLPSCWEMSH
jgi:hypothetical protein